MMKKRFEKGFTLVEVIIAAGIFLMIAVSLLGLSQMEAHGILNLWNDSYMQSAMNDAVSMIEQMPCDQISLLSDHLIFKIGKKEIIVAIKKNMKETLCGKIMWDIALCVQTSRQELARQMKRECP